NDPDIEGLPDKQTARFVDRRLYREFAVSWPAGAGELHADAGGWRQPTAGEEEGARATWRPRFLHSVSGRVTERADGAIVPEGSSIPGFLFVIPEIDASADAEDCMALPACCPACGANYSRRMYRTSPVRGFRTGFSRVSQLLSKELFYSLPAGETRKLVVFSDSREDAASISNGIERTHYLDLVRETMYDELYRVALGEGLLLSDLEAHGAPNCAAAVACATENPETVTQFLRELELERTPIPDGLPAILRDSLVQEQQRAARALAGIRQQATTRMVPLRILYESDPHDTSGTRSWLLIKRLKRLGINPAGNDVMYQMFNYEGEDHDWTEFFDYSDPARCWREGLPDGAIERRDRVRGKVRTEIMNVLFSRLYFGFESAGLGYACLDLHEEDWARLSGQAGLATGIFRELCHGCVRILGDLYRYHQERQPAPDRLDDWADWVQPPARARLRNYIRACAQAHGLDELTLRDVTWEAICLMGGQEAWSCPQRSAVAYSGLQCLTRSGECRQFVLPIRFLRVFVDTGPDSPRRRTAR
ncbi:MAG: hypothetical protein L7F78_17025, partial [Syntrophales bacterium LBB04]|nr:hypothetical protein [Syntrophales bacterium LBB04]